MSRVEDGGGLWALVTDVRMAGAFVRLELDDREGRQIQVEIGREQYSQIRAIIGKRVYVTPRRVRVFMSDASGPSSATAPSLLRRGPAPS